MSLGTYLRTNKLNTTIPIKLNPKTKNVEVNGDSKKKVKIFVQFPTDFLTSNFPGHKITNPTYQYFQTGKP